MTVKLPRLPINWQQQPGLFERYWSDLLAQIEKNINDLSILPTVTNDTATALSTANTAQTIANVAQSTADTAQGIATVASTAATSAQTTADTVTSDVSIVNSYIPPSSFTAPLISITSAGVLTIANHSRVYENSSLNPTVSVTGASTTVAGTSAGSVVRIYYSDPSRAGGVVSYQTTIDPANPPIQGGNIHCVGVVTVPASGSATGNVIKGPGFVY